MLQDRHGFSKTPVKMEAKNEPCFRGKEKMRDGRWASLEQYNSRKVLQTKTLGRQNKQKRAYSEPTEYIVVRKPPLPW